MSTYPRLNRTRIIAIYLKTIGKQWDDISAYERTVLSSFADELIKQCAQSTNVTKGEVDR